MSLASRRRTAAPPRVSRQSCHARRRVDHHVPCAPDAGGQSSRSPGATERTDRPRPSRAENAPPQPAHARLQGPPTHGKIATILLQETARPGKRRLSWLIRSRNALVRLSGRPPAVAGSTSPFARGATWAMPLSNGFRRPPVSVMDSEASGSAGYQVPVITKGRMRFGRGRQAAPPRPQLLMLDRNDRRR